LKYNHLTPQPPERIKNMSEELSLKNMRRQMMSPGQNPYLIAPSVTIKKGRKIVARTDQPLIDPATGEITHCKSIHQIEELDRENFVKVFASGLAAAYELTKTGQKVLQLVLEQYEKTPMVAGYADCVELYWFGNGIEGRDVGMSEKTFSRGIKELLQNSFMHPRTSSSYWVNPAMFWKGSRVLFVREYRLKQSTDKKKAPALPEQNRDPNTIDFINQATDKELKK
jgi:hypothetical protein